MKKLFTFITLLTIIISISNCKKKEEEETITEKQDSIIVELTEDFQLIKISIYKKNVFSEVREFDHYSDSVTLTIKDNESQILSENVYYLNINGKADSLIHRSVVNDLYYNKNAYHNIFDSDGCKIQSNLSSTTRTISTDSVVNSRDYFIHYEIVNGNSISVDYGFGPMNYRYNDLVNKLDVILDYNDYFSLQNVNLIEYSGPSYSGLPSTAPSNSSYSYKLDSNGLVIEEIVLYVSSYHTPDEEPSKTRTTTKYVYQYQ
jgi:hypothetical protein